MGCEVYSIRGILISPKDTTTINRRKCAKYSETQQIKDKEYISKCGWVLYFIIIVIGGCVGTFYLTIKYLGNIAGIILGIFIVCIYTPIAIAVMDIYGGK